jgi:hypothetical protein
MGLRCEHIKKKTDEQVVAVAAINISKHVSTIPGFSFRYCDSYGPTPLYE